MASQFSDTEENNSELNDIAYKAELEWSCILCSQVPLRPAGQFGERSCRNLAMGTIGW